MAVDEGGGSYETSGTRRSASRGVDQRGLVDRLSPFKRL